MLPSRNPAFPSSSLFPSSVRSHPYQSVSAGSAAQHVLPHAPRRGTTAASFPSFSHASPPPPPINSAGFFHSAHASAQFAAFPSSPSSLQASGLRLQIQNVDLQVSSLPREKHANLFCPICSRPCVERYRTVPCYHVACGACAEELQEAGRCSMCGAGVTSLEVLHPLDELYICRETGDCFAAFLNPNSLAYHVQTVHQLPALQPLVDAVAASRDSGDTKALKQFLHQLREDERKQSASSSQMRLSFPASPVAATAAVSSLPAAPPGRPVPGAGEPAGSAASAASVPAPSSLPSSAFSSVRTPGLQAPSVESQQNKADQGVVPAGLQDASLARTTEDTREGRDGGAASGVGTPGGGGGQGREDGRAPPQPIRTPAPMTASPVAMEEEDEDLEGVL
ncbi:conserved hypothetical protein [Neospora caninum Liverpool]|uniref:RING-type domain-containing protein n=1 Tax=Neospora caninum (strain Liverpool) TaxID=572307 RepID=F0VKM3_NEOCL|nr:conserved hypothetical protein [Neospora caninum Liverpool]CBZ54624.1 conserved hypothetical protein [Neospora caninum Liverpool]CEL69340.1 TPA: hypothetical protein BN1204_050520 [Neospora caninum Liverpool]|eukprot:XP_003884654.1 conserved hypothetical protein [Neospora caninum Liverpool]